MNRITRGCGCEYLSEYLKKKLVFQVMALGQPSEDHLHSEPYTLNPESQNRWSSSHSPMSTAALLKVSLKNSPPKFHKGFSKALYVSL